MTPINDLLFEIGCEELPPASLQKISKALSDSVRHALDGEDIGYVKLESYATPRRIGFLIKGLETAQPDKQVDKRGPAITAAFDKEGKPSKAALGFAKSCNTSIENLERLKTDKGEWLSFSQQIIGRRTVEIIPAILVKAINSLPIAKRMRWGGYDTEFARPVHWVVLVFGEKIVDWEILGKKTGSITYGHRFHAPFAIKLDTPDSYERLLENEGKVIVDFERRRNIVRDLAEKAAQEINGHVLIDNSLLDEITAINEWPVPVLGSFDKKYLDLPQEVLVTTMQKNQKYFPVIDNEGELLPRFITFSNIDSKNPDAIRRGNEKVILPRLADAEFFWNQDRKQRLEQRIDALENVVFQQTLGTLGDKSRRVTYLVEHIATQMKVDAKLAKRAATLAKTDLLTNMVGEFAGLQGVMGRYYAQADNEHKDVAAAMEEQYMPKQSGGAVPDSQVGQALSLAEKIDTLCGIFSVGLTPTGDKDPYALRRTTLGALRIIIEKELQLDVVDLIDVGLAQLTHDFDKSLTRRQLVEFVFDRLKGYCVDLGFKVDEFDAVFQIMPTQPLDFMRRLKAVQEFRNMKEAESLAAANKRIRNILKKAHQMPDRQIGELVESQEKQLLAEARQAESDVRPLLNNNDYKQALNRLAQLRQSVDEFFDHVMVNTDDPTLKNSRLALLTMLSGLFLEIADISRLQT